MSTYSDSHKAYYERNRNKINYKRKEYSKKYNELYYLAHKDELNQKRKEYYHRRKEFFLAHPELKPEPRSKSAKQKLRRLNGIPVKIFI